MTGTITEPNLTISSFDHAVVVAPNDGANLPGPGFCRGLWVGGAGNLTVDMAGGELSVLISGIPAGTFMPIRVTRVRATGTTATLIVQLY